MTVGILHMTREDQAIWRRVEGMSRAIWQDTRDYQSMLTIELGKAGLVSVPCCDVCGSEEVGADAPARWDADRQRWEAVDIYDGDHWCDDCEAEIDLQWRYRPIDGERFKGDDARRDHYWARVPVMGGSTREH